jgi:hypothetical protein
MLALPWQYRNAGRPSLAVSDLEEQSPDKGAHGQSNEGDTGSRASNGFRSHRQQAEQPAGESGTEAAVMACHRVGLCSLPEVQLPTVVEVSFGVPPVHSGTRELATLWTRSSKGQKEGAKHMCCGATIHDETTNKLSSHTWSRLNTQIRGSSYKNGRVEDIPNSSRFHEHLY